MDLSEAMRIVSSRVHLPGRSDGALLNQVRHMVDIDSPIKKMSPAVGLEAGVSLRPVEALHLLSYATRPGTKMIYSIRTFSGDSFGTSASLSLRGTGVDNQG